MKSIKHKRVQFPIHNKYILQNYCVIKEELDTFVLF